MTDKKRCPLKLKATGAAEAVSERYQTAHKKKFSGGT
jgi:hypothetical protein